MALDVFFANSRLAWVAGKVQVLGHRHRHGIAGGRRRMKCRVHALHSIAIPKPQSESCDGKKNTDDGGYDDDRWAAAADDVGVAHAEAADAADAAVAHDDVAVKT